MRGRRRKAVPGQPDPQLIREVNEAERLDLGEAHCGDGGQRPVEVSGQGVTNGVELQGEFRHS
jgi:hypothetical protein